MFFRGHRASEKSTELSLLEAKLQDDYEIIGFFIWKKLIPIIWGILCLFL